MYESIYTQKEQTEKQIASNERISEMMQLFVEQYQSGAITYEQAMSHISELANAMSGGYSAMEQLDGLMSFDGIKDLSQITSSSAEKISSTVEALTQYMDIVKANNESINSYTTSWLEMQADIADRLTGLESLSVSAEEFRKYLETVKANQTDLSEYTQSWANVSDDVKKQIEILKSLTGSFADFQKYIDAVKANQIDIDQYTHSWGDVKESVDGQVAVIKATTETLDEFRKYLEMVKGNENELSNYVHSWGDVRESVDRQIEALDNSSMSLEEFQKYLEAVKSNRDELSNYTQTWGEIKEDVERQVSILEGMSGSFEDIQKFINTINDNRKGLEEYVQTWKAVRESVESQVSALGSSSDAMEQFRKNLESYQKNVEDISKYTATWEQLKDSIAEQVEALKQAAEALEGFKKNPLKWILQMYPGATEQGGLIRIPIGGDIEDDGRGWGNDGGSSKHSSSDDDDDDSGYVSSGPGHTQEAYEAWLDEQKKNNTYHSGIEKGAIGDSDNDKVDTLKALSLRPLRPDEMPIIARMGEVMLNKEQQDQMISNLNHIYDASSYAPLLSGLSHLAPGSKQPQNKMEVSIGDIVVQEVQNPDAFAKALYRRIEPAMNQNFSKIFG